MPDFFFGQDPLVRPGVRRERLQTCRQREHLHAEISADLTKWNKDWPPWPDDSAANYAARTDGTDTWNELFWAAFSRFAQPGGDRSRKLKPMTSTGELFELGDNALLNSATKQTGTADAPRPFDLTGFRRRRPDGHPHEDACPVRGEGD